MDPSVLWCLGPDFDKQTILSLLGDGNCMESAFMQPTTPIWCMSSPSQWTHTSAMHEPPIYTPRSVMSELGPQSPTNAATKRPFSDLSNRTTGTGMTRPMSIHASNIAILFCFLLVYLKTKTNENFCFSSFEANRSFSNHQVPTKLEFSTPVRSMTPDLYSRVPSSIKRSRITPALTSSSSSYETPPPPLPVPSATSSIDSAE
jgi:hypothetical protein